MISIDKVGQVPASIPKEPTPPSDKGDDDMSAEEKKELAALRSLKIETDGQVAGISAKLVQIEAEKTDLQTKLAKFDGLKADYSEMRVLLDKAIAERDKLKLEIPDPNIAAEKDRLVNSISEEKQKEIDVLTAQVVAKNAMVDQLRENVASLKNQISKFSKQGFNRLFEDAVARIVRREGIAVKRALQRKDLASFEGHLDEFYRGLPEFASNTLQPAITSYAEMVGSTGAINCLSSYVPNHIRESRDEISKWVGVLVHDTTDFKRNEAGIEDCLNVWVEKRPEKAAISFQAFFASS